MPLRPYANEDQMYKIVDACIELVEKSGLKYDACIELVEKSGLKYEIGAMSTTFEGEFDEVFELIKKMHKLPFELNCE